VSRIVRFLIPLTPIFSFRRHCDKPSAFSQSQLVVHPFSVELLWALFPPLWCSVRSWLPFGHVLCFLRPRSFRPVEVLGAPFFLDSWRRQSHVPGTLCSLVSFPFELSPLVSVLRCPLIFFLRLSRRFMLLSALGSCPPTHGSAVPQCSLSFP